MRITCKADEVMVQVNDVTVAGRHAVLGQPKTALTFLVFGDTAAFRNVKVVR